MTPADASPEAEFLDKETSGAKGAERHARELIALALATVKRGAAATAAERLRALRQMQWAYRAAGRFGFTPVLDELCARNGVSVS